MSERIEILKEKIVDKTANIGVVGLGYVGLPLAVSVAEAGYKVTGFDLNKEVVKAIMNGRSPIEDIPDETIKKLVNSEKLVAVLEDDNLVDLDIILICVPTPLTPAKEPDLRAVEKTARKIGKLLASNKIECCPLIILESTTYPGTTKDVVLPLLERVGLKLAEDFFLAFSPERIDPGNKEFNIENTPKVVGGIDKDSTLLAEAFYKQFVEQVIVVSSTEVAEMAKLLENIFRAVNIALVNELMILCDRMDIDIWEVIEAAKTKPYGFMSFTPGPGLGGHCIPIDPFYLSWKARMYDFHTEFIELAGKVNENIPYYVCQKIGEALNQYKKSLNESSILILGVAYKKDIGDTRESPALKLIELLNKRGAKIKYHDKHVPSIKIDELAMKSADFQIEKADAYDCLVITTDHSHLDYKAVAQKAKLIVDCRNTFGKDKPANVVTI